MFFIWAGFLKKIIGIFYTKYLRDYCQLQEIILTKEPDERLGMHIKGGLNGQKGNPFDNSDEGVFVSKINSTGAARRDGRLKVGQRLLEVNGVSLLGASHQEAVDCLRAAGNQLYLVVCKGYDKSGPVNPLNVSNAPKVDANGAEQCEGVTNNNNNNITRTSETGSELSHSVSSLDRDDDAFLPVIPGKGPVPEPVHEIAPTDHENNNVDMEEENTVSNSTMEVEPKSVNNSVTEFKGKSTPEKV